MLRSTTVIVRVHPRELWMSILHVAGSCPIPYRPFCELLNHSREGQQQKAWPTFRAVGGPHPRAVHCEMEAVRKHRQNPVLFTSHFFCLIIIHIPKPKHSILFFHGCLQFWTLQVSLGNVQIPFFSVIVQFLKRSTMLTLFLLPGFLHLVKVPAMKTF